MPARAAAEPVAWSRAASIYEVNLRHCTAEGSLAAFAAHLPRLAAMGVDIVWLMPIHPVGERRRKGACGSPYAVRDHLAVDPGLGDLDDLRRLVREVHARGMHLIIDWVAHHTAWDHVWVERHPDWYRRNRHGELVHCTYDAGGRVEHWTDVVPLDYDNPALWPAMIDAMAFWVREAGIDGFRCDVAGRVPIAFWQRARATLDTIRPMFMLAEWSDPALHAQAFDMSYDWALFDALQAVVHGAAAPSSIATCVRRQAARFPPHAYRMLFTSNHDLNAWRGSDVELWGPAFEACAVLCATLPGMPLVYAGQEAGLGRRLALFDRDPIDWRELRHADLYRELLQLKRRHPALWNGAHGGTVAFQRDSAAPLLAFRRQRGVDWVTVRANLSAWPQSGLPAWGWTIESA